MKACLLLLSSLLPLLLNAVKAAVLDFQADFGGIPDDSTHTTCKFNTELFSQVLQHNASDNTIVFDSLFHFYNGVFGEHLQNVKLIINGILRFERPPVKTVERPPACIMIVKSTNITVSSNNTDASRGLIDGRGSNYWGVPVVGYLELVEHRPRLVRMNETSNILIENLVFQDSPYHTVYLESVNNTVIRNVSIVARRTPSDGHSWIDLSAFNTDGMDLSGRNIHVHDVDIWVQDDCIAVKDNYFGSYISEDMVFENVNCSGFGFVLGSIGGTIVRNITFRDSYLHKSVKGIYLKFREPGPFWEDLNKTHGLMEDIHFENIKMDRPLQWPVWIGPAQQSDSKRPCHPNPCSLCWPQNPVAECNVVERSAYRDITLSNVIINNPKMSPGVIMGGEEPVNDLENIEFYNVKVTTGPPIYKDLNRTEAFPGLLQPIVDHFVPPGTIIEDDDNICKYCLFMGILNGICLLVIWLDFRRDTRATSDNDTLHVPLLSVGNIPRSSRRTKALKLFVYLLLLVAVDAIAWQVKKWSTPKWNRTDRYFRCMGVVNGTATGETWPVPDCFAKV